MKLIGPFKPVRAKFYCNYKVVNLINYQTYSSSMSIVQRLEEDIEIFAEVTEELEHENLAKRTEIEDLMKYLALVRPRPVRL